MRKPDFDIWLDKYEPLRKGDINPELHGDQAEENWFIWETNYGKNQKLLFYPKKDSKGIKPTIKNIYKLLKSYENPDNK